MSLGTPYRILIVGGGTAGWMTAAAMSRFLLAEKYEIVLIESEVLGTVGVGEATIPHIRQFNSLLGIDENDFIQATNATYKLGISFEDWSNLGERYIHPFGSFGHDINGIEFHHYWIKLHKEGLVRSLDDYSMAVVAARKDRFEYPNESDDSLTSSYAYAFHIDAGLYAKYLRNYAENKGVIRKEGMVTQIIRDHDSGDISAVVTKAGERLDADLFIDCSGFRGLIIEQELHTGFDDWSESLPCDRAVALPCEHGKGRPSAYTQAIAREAGWQWRIPLQHRVGNGYVYSSRYLSDEEAFNKLSERLEGAALAAPNFLKFSAGRRKKSWNKNCVAIGLSSGFLEPLESTSIYLIQLGIIKLLEFFPGKIIQQELRDEFNKVIELEYLRIRDFLILHYKATKRSDSDFWKYCKQMNIPDELQRKITLFKASAHIEKYEQGLFMLPSWLAVYLGQEVYPENYDSRIFNSSPEKINELLGKMRDRLELAADAMPLASTAIQRALSPSVVNYPGAIMSLYGVKQ